MPWETIFERFQNKKEPVNSLKYGDNAPLSARCRVTHWAVENLSALQGIACLLSQLGRKERKREKRSSPRISEQERDMLTVCHLAEMEP